MAKTPIFLVLAFACDSPSSQPMASEPSRIASEPTPVTEPVARDARAVFPAPPSAARSAQIPSLELQLNESWSSIEAGSDDAAEFLAAISWLVGEGGAPANLTSRLREHGRFESVRLSYMLVARSGKLPDRVERLARAHFVATAHEANRGLWGEERSRDLTVLAAFLDPDDPMPQRELINARFRHGWTRFEADRRMPRPWIPWLALPWAAHERLQAIDQLTDGEHQRWCSHFGLTVVQRVDPATGNSRPSCGCESGQSVTWEDEPELYPFTVPGGCLRCGEHRAVYFVTGDRSYGVNGAGVAAHGSQESIWADDPEHAGQSMNLGWLIGRGLRLCN